MWNGHAYNRFASGGACPILFLVYTTIHRRVENCIIRALWYDPEDRSVPLEILLEPKRGPR